MLNLTCIHFVILLVISFIVASYFVFIVKLSAVTEPQPETPFDMDIPRDQFGEDNVVNSGTVECFEFTEAEELLVECLYFV